MLVLAKAGGCLYDIEAGVVYPTTEVRVHEYFYGKGTDKLGVPITIANGKDKESVVVVLI